MLFKITIMQCPIVGILFTINNMTIKGSKVHYILCQIVFWLQFPPVDYRSGA